MNLALALLLLTPLAHQPKPGGQGTPTSHFATLNERKVHYVDSGGDATEAIVLVHGLASDHTMHEAQLQGLRHRARVLAIDLPGYGKSDMPKSEFSMDLFAEGITAVLDDAGVERAVLVGHSNGVPISRHFYRTQPDRTLALVSLDGAMLEIFSEEQIEDWRSVLSSENYEQAIKAKVAPVFATSYLTDEQKAHALAVLLGTPKETVVGAFEARIGSDEWTKGPILVPTLVINAPRPTWTSEYLQSVNALGPEIEIQHWQEVSHLLVMEKTDELNARINGFLDRHRLLQEPNPESHFAILNHHRVHYIDSGPTTDTPADQAIVLIHGWASDLTLLDAQFQGLRDKARVISIDLPGHGKSEAPETKYSMDLFAEGIASVLDQAGVERAVLVGHSNGVPTIRQFYRQHPDRTLALVCLDGALFKVFPDVMVKPFLTMLSSEDYLQTIESLSDGFLASSTLSPDQREHLRKVMRETPQHAIVGGLEAASDSAIWIEDQITVPTLVINAPSPLWAPEYHKKVENLGPNIEIQNWEGVSHMLMMEQPERMNAEIEGFIDRHDLLD